MSLSSAIKTLLNKFADSQPALRLPDSSYEKSNIMLGDLIDTAGSQAAEDVAYVPATSGDWSGDPVEVKEALDRIAAEVAVLKGSAIS